MPTIPNNEAEIWCGLIDQMISSAARAGAAIDEAVAFVDASNIRMAALEASLKLDCKRE